MPLAELIYGCVLGLAAIGGFVVEWRRGSHVEARLVALESQDLPDRVFAIEATIDRMRRAV